MSIIIDYDKEYVECTHCTCRTSFDLLKDWVVDFDSEEDIEANADHFIVCPTYIERKEMNDDACREEQI